MKSHLSLHILSTRQRMNIPIQDRVILGRSSESDSDGTPNVDLSPFLAYQLGVSRRHVMLACRDDGRVLAFDLSSSNGSFINGRLMSAHIGHPIHDGDELTLGSLGIRLYYAIDMPYAEMDTVQLKAIDGTRDTMTGVTSRLAAPKPNIRSTLATIYNADGWQQTDM